MTRSNRSPGRSRVRVAAVVGALVLVAAMAIGVVPASANVGDMTVMAGKLKAGAFKASGPADKVALNSPHGIAYDRNTSGDPWAQTTFIADTAFCSVRAVDSSGNLTTIVNSGKHKMNFCGAATPGTSATSLLDDPHGLTYDHVHEQLYIADLGNADVIDVDLTTSTPTLSICPTVLSTSQPLIAPVSVTVHGNTGELWVADMGANIVAHYAYPCSSGAPTIVAGVYGTSGWNGDAQPCTSADLANPDGVDYDVATGALLISDTGNNEIRQCAGGTISHVLGTPPSSGLTSDGSYPGGNVPINAPHGCKADGSGALFFDEVGNNLVRRFDPASGTLTTEAGGGSNPLPTKVKKFPVPGTSVALDGPHGIAFIQTSPTSADLAFSDTNVDTVLRVSGVAVPI
jgi:hypothetical protein